MLQRWIQIQYEDFELNQNLLKTMKKFLEVDVRTCGFVMEAEFIEKNISQKVSIAESLCVVNMQNTSKKQFIDFLHYRFYRT